MKDLKVRDLMTENVFSIRADEDLSKLHDLMMEINIRHVPVIDDEENVVGLVSQRDLLRSTLDTDVVLPSSQQKSLLQTTSVDEVMVTNPETVSPDMSLGDAGRLMLENKWGCLPVTEGGRLVGILTESDFIKYVVA